MRARSGVTERARREAGEARAPGVARALKALGQAGDNKTPTTAHGCVSYMRAALPHVRTLFAYYWNAAHARAAFNATAAKQRATRALAERLAPPPPGWDPGRDRPPPGARRTPADTRLVVMGAADFKPAVRGSRGAFKSLASAIAALPWVVMIFFPEDLTSATCSACGRRLLPVYGTKTVVVRGPDGGRAISERRVEDVWALKQCPNTACGKTWQRDVNAAHNMNAAFVDLMESEATLHVAEGPGPGAAGRTPEQRAANPPVRPPHLTRAGYNDARNVAMFAAAEGRYERRMARAQEKVTNADTARRDRQADAYFLGRRRAEGRGDGAGNG